MAMVLYQSGKLAQDPFLIEQGDPAEAVVYQQKAVIINERVQGVDHHETAQSYVSIICVYVLMNRCRVTWPFSAIKWEKYLLRSATSKELCILVIWLVDWLTPTMAPHLYVNQNISHFQ